MNKHLIVRKLLKAADEVKYFPDELDTTSAYLMYCFNSRLNSGEAFLEVGDDLNNARYYQALNEKYKSGLEEIRKMLKNELLPGIRDEKYKKIIREVLNKYEEFFEKWTECSKYKEKLKNLFVTYVDLNLLQKNFQYDLKKEIASRKRK